MRLSRTYQAFLDALPDATALVDTDGVIRAINTSWKRFTAENDGDTRTYYLDRNYFSVCDATTAESGTLSSEVALGLSAILRRAKIFLVSVSCSANGEHVMEPTCTEVL